VETTSYICHWSPASSLGQSMRPWNTRGHDDVQQTTDSRTHTENQQREASRVSVAVP